MVEQIALILIALGLLGRLHILLSFLNFLSDVGVVLFLGKFIKSEPLKKSVPVAIMVGILYIISFFYPVAYFVLLLFVSALCALPSKRILPLAVNTITFFSILAIYFSGLPYEGGWFIRLVWDAEIAFVVNFAVVVLTLVAILFVMVSMHAEKASKIIAPLLILAIIFSSLYLITYPTYSEESHIVIHGNYVVSDKAVAFNSLSVSGNLVLVNSNLFAKWIQVDGKIILKNSSLVANGNYEGKIVSKNGVLSELKVYNSSIIGSKMEVHNVALKNCELNVSYLHVVFSNLRGLIGKIGTLDTYDDGRWYTIMDSNLTVGHVFNMLLRVVNSTMRVGWSDSMIVGENSRIIPFSEYEIDFNDGKVHEVAWGNEKHRVNGKYVFTANLSYYSGGDGRLNWNDTTVLNISIDGEDHRVPFYWWKMRYDGNLDLNETAERILNEGDVINGKSDTLYYLRDCGSDYSSNVSELKIENEEVRNITVMGRSICCPVEVVVANATLRNSNFYDAHLDTYGTSYLVDGKMTNGYVDIMYNASRMNLHISNFTFQNSALISYYPYDGSKKFLYHQLDWRYYKHSNIFLVNSTLFSVDVNLLNTSLNMDGTLIISDVGVKLSNSDVSGGYILGGFYGLFFEEWFGGNDSVENSTVLGNLSAIFLAGCSNLTLHNVKLRGIAFSILGFSVENISSKNVDVQGAVGAYNSHIKADNLHETVILFDGSTYEGKAAKLMIYNGTLKSVVPFSLYVRSSLVIGPFSSAKLGDPILVIFMLLTFLLDTNKKRAIAYLLSPLLMLNVPLISLVIGLALISGIVILRRKIPDWQFSISYGTYLLLFVPLLYSRNILFLILLFALLPSFLIRGKLRNFALFSLAVAQAVLIVLLQVSFVSDF